MANHYEPTEEQQRTWREWVASLRPHVRAVAERFEPWKLYKLPGDGDHFHRVLIYSFGEEEDGRVTVKVAVTGRFNHVAFERMVFGIKPEELTECDLPGPDEKLGVAFTRDIDVKGYIASVRAEVTGKGRPQG